MVGWPSRCVLSRPERSRKYGADGVEVRAIGRRNCDYDPPVRRALAAARKLSAAHGPVSKTRRAAPELPTIQSYF
eukprot:scaffold9622_cov113-Isochrysis_galbana.AAC.4